MAFYIDELQIQNVRGLKNITIEKVDGKHIILTGKNGSGKTSVLNAISTYLNALTTDREFINYSEYLSIHSGEAQKLREGNGSENEIYKHEHQEHIYQKKIIDAKQGIELQFNYAMNDIYASFQQGRFIVAYYKDHREFKATIAKHVEKVVLKDHYGIAETPRQEFVKVLVDMKTTEAMSARAGKIEKANGISRWFDDFESLMKKIFDDQTLKVIFDEDTFSFHLQAEGREPFDFNTLSSGYGAVLDIVVDLILRMQNNSQQKFVFDMSGIVLIDEVETHLHLDLQKNIMSLLTTVFPNVQFILTTHSPFILNSLSDVIIYDLQEKRLVENGLQDISYEGIVEGYFGANTMSIEINQGFERYKDLVGKSELTDEEFAEIARIEMQLEEIPDFLSPGISTEYQRLKLEFEAREDIG